MVAYIVVGCSEGGVQRHEISMKIASRIRDTIVHEKWENMFSRAPPEMAEVFSICGTPEICVEKIDRLLKLGVAQLIAGSPIGPNMRKSINMIATEVFPHFKEN